MKKEVNFVVMLNLNDRYRHQHVSTRAKIL